MTDRREWLKQRQSSIGASDAPAILGLSPWKTALDVYAEKIADTIDETLTPAMEWGIRLESAIAAACKDHYGWALTECGSIKHREHPHLSATPDRILVKTGELLEIKTASNGDEWGEPDTDEIPVHYWAQVQHQLAVLNSHTPTPAAYVVVLISGRELRRYRVEYNPEYLELALPQLDWFWQCVESRSLPQPDWEHPRTPAAVARAYRPADGKAVELDADAAGWADAYQAIGKQIAELTAERDRLKAMLTVRMADAEQATLPDGRRINRRTIHKDGYTVKPSSHVDFRISQPRKVAR